MALKLPPALIFVFFAAIMYLLATFLPVGYFDFFGRHLLVKILLVSAILLGSIAIMQFLRAKTTVDPLNPSKAQKLVTKGLYNYSRNPMYLTMLLILLAWGIWLGNAFNTVTAAAFVAYMNKFQIIPEEEALKKKFGKDFERYLIKVRRWF